MRAAVIARRARGGPWPPAEERLHHDGAGELDQAARLLPHQGPIGVFIHQNTLSALEHLPFDDALQMAERLLGARTRLTEGEYREMLADGRIAEADLRAVFAREALADDDAADGLPSTRTLAWLVLRHGIDEEPWRVRAFRQSEALGEPAIARAPPPARDRVARGCRALLDRASLEELGTLLASAADPELADERAREQLGLAGVAQARSATGDDLARLGFAMSREMARLHTHAGGSHEGGEPLDAEEVHERVDDLLLPVVGAQLDHGHAAWRPGATSQGLWGLACEVLGAPGMAGLRTWRRRAVRAVRAVRGETAESVLDAALRRVDPNGGRRVEVLAAALHARAGWAGAVAFAEAHGRGARLVDYAALRLLLTVEVSEAMRRSPADVLRPPAAPPLYRAALADRMAQVSLLAGVPPDVAVGLPEHGWARLRQVVCDTDQGWRCRLLHEARERRSNRSFLDALAAHPGMAVSRRPDWQVVFCIDEREESMRRAVEEIGGNRVETFGTAGFFGLAITWSGLDDPHPTPRCPAILTPTHHVEERAARSSRRGWLRRIAGRAGRALDVLGRTLAGGVPAVWLAGVPVLATAAARVLAPRASLALARAVARAAAPVPDGVLSVVRERVGEPGFTPAEAADRLAAVLTGMGLASPAPVVLILGHGSTSLNNPHESAHDCGACGGFRGTANARVFAELANRPDVRAALAERGCRIPDDTVFVGGYHDTASDDVALYGTAQGLDDLRAVLEAARARNAAERMRRFDGAGAASRARALAHVERRASDLSQVRPEYGHATNALLVVGPRARTRGLFLDRRAFLQSWDPATDPAGEVLQRQLAAAVPVCAGINLEYYFSRVDNERFGCGTKIPHNVVGLHGVVNGSQGDLRTGLPWQMVEIHEPVRLLVVVLAGPERVAAAVGRLPAVERLVAGRWIHLVALDEGGVHPWGAT